MSFNQFIQRVVNYVANEVIIKGLANSRTFQRFAVRTDKSLQDLTKASSETFQQAMNELAQQQQKQQVRLSSSQAGPPQPPLGGFVGFVSAFVKEIRKDLGMGK